MILRQIELKNIGCFAFPIGLGPLDPAMNLIHAPNETGKSTIVKAVARGLFDRYTAGGREIQGLQPWGASVAPEITLVLESDGKRYRLRKRFLKQQECELHRQVGEVFESWLEGDEADRFVRELLHGELPGRGPTKPEQWGLARMLWCVQEPGQEALCGVSEAVAEQLRAALPGGVPASTRYEKVSQAVERRYGEHFTAQGKVRAGSPVDALRKSLEDLGQQIKVHEEALAAVEQAGRELQETTARLARLQEEKDESEARLAAYEAAAGRFDAVRQQVAKLEEELQRSGREAQTVSKDHTECHRALRAAEDTSRQLQELEPRLTECRAERAVLAATVRRLEEQLAAARREREAAAAAWQRCIKLGQAAQTHAEAEKLAVAIAELREVELSRGEAERELQRPWPGAADLARAAELETAITGLQVQLQVAGLSVTVNLEREQVVELDGGPARLTTTRGAGEELTYQAGSRLALHLPGVARIQVASGAREATGLEEELRATIAEHSELLARFGVNQTAALTDLQVEHQARERDLRELRSQIKRLAGEHKDLAGLEKARAGKEFERDRVLAELGLTAAELGRQEGASDAVLEKAAREAQARENEIVRELQTRGEQAEKQLAAEQELAGLRSKLEGEAQLRRATAAQLLTRYELKTLDELAAQLAAREAAAAAQEAELADLRAALPPGDADPALLATAQRQALADIEEQEKTLTEARWTRQGIIDQAQAAGRYEELVRLQEQSEAKQQELERAHREALSIRLLRQVLHERHAAATTPQLPHLEEAIERMMAAVSGRSRGVRVSDGYRVEGLAEERDGAQVHGLDDLSAGTREQLDLVTRIALGEAYSEQYGRTMMVLDDALLYTDPARHDRVKLVLARAAKLLQVFIITSHPERYRGLVGDEFQFDLEAIVARARAEQAV